MQFKLTESLTPESALEAEAALAHFLQTGKVPAHEWEMEQYCKNGSTVWVDVTVNVVNNEAGHPHEIIGITRDATARRRMEQTLQHMAHYDQLTGLPNRTLFFDRLARDLSRARRNEARMALLFMDLDGFKAANDTHGHDVGDQLLREVAERITNCVRESDTVARMGGDEFIVTLDIHIDDDAARMAQKLISVISTPYHPSGSEVRLGTSIGISLFPEHSGNLEELLTLADAAMYQVKQNGKNNYRFHRL
jgi:diguanylate cyclase (GGDEF)-like protein